MSEQQREERKLQRGEGLRPSTHEPELLPKPRRRLAERGLDERVQRKGIPFKPGEPVDQSPPTAPSPTAPGERGEVVFETYTPVTPPRGVLQPPDPTGADGERDVVLMLGNSYLSVSTDGGGSFTDVDPTAFLPAAVGRAVDQVMTYVPHRDLFAWMMQHGTDGSGDGTFRLAVAAAKDVAADVKTAWTVWDFTSSMFGAPKTATDRQDLAFDESHLYLTTNLVGKGRIVVSLSLQELAAGGALGYGYTDPLDAMYQFSCLSQQNPSNVYSVAIKDASTLQAMFFDDGAGVYSFHDITVGQFPTATDLSSKDPDGIDWLTRGVANVSASVVRGDDLWIAWDAAASGSGDSPTFKNAHVRLARVDRTSWTRLEERQVWNDDYAFAYGCLAIGPNGDVGYGVAVGGSSDYPNSCFGILGDYVVYFRDTSTATAGAGSEPRWGDYITVRPSVRDGRRFAAFGYFTVKASGGGETQSPYFLSYGRP
ncbi:hypothetical protein P5G50_06720 [Leifsonia sp. F6_8S_P_1B]|uniref:Uncharacterized protein n=1 Tax=Leifsonia williamsii TaxID=3035919 RepID=A0ABT8KAV9_9MICO|nr:hypothetical protein [Leifsonia williamsii]MDN4614143.1 hypothetical protein [Leifsonia williamsii]